MEIIKLDQFAAMNMIYNRHSFEYFLDSMERLEIFNFELWTGAPHLCNFIETLSDASKVRRAVEKRNLNIVCVTPEQVMYPHNIAAANPELRRWSLDYFHKYINQTTELGVNKMLCCAGWGNYDEDKEEAWKRSMESLNEMTEHASKVGIILAFEILNPYESNIVNDFPSTVRMMKEIESDHFKLCVDTVPMRLCGHSLDDFFEEFKDRICHVHLTDGTPAGHVPAGEGEHPIGGYINSLSEHHYKGYITLEIGDTSWSTRPELATLKGFQTVKKYL